ncbi:MAG: 4Fe-4S dicluster domain-containing protein [Alphaproteobacteria bacterium]|nr:4Fe-4S dicluster domain-containing protein [Alphaproteobacteria bacterium]
MAGRAVGFVSRVAARPYLRPPGSVAESEFVKRCIRCFQCGNICPNGAIRFHGLDAGLGQAFTPYINPREQGCIGCMKCTEVCPSGAIRPVDPDPEVVIHDPAAKMGVARLNEDMCYSFAEPARTCGVCYRACPYPGEAMTIGLWERPTVHRDKCIGCGLCEQSCIHLPQAIRVLPFDRETS